MKKRITLMISSAGIISLYTLSKLLIARNDNSSIYAGGIIAIIAGIIAFCRFIIFRKAYKLAINELAGVISSIYIMWNPHPGDEGFDHIMNISIITAGIATILYFTYLYKKSDNLLSKLEDLATIFFVIAGSTLLMGHKIVSLLFSGVGYYITGRFENLNTKKDQIYTIFCYIAAVLSIIYGIYKIFKGFT